MTAQQIPLCSLAKSFDYDTRGPNLSAVATSADIRLVLDRRGLAGGVKACRERQATDSTLNKVQLMTLIWGKSDISEGCLDTLGREMG